MERDAKENTTSPIPTAKPAEEDLSKLYIYDNKGVLLHEMSYQEGKWQEALDKEVVATKGKILEWLKFETQGNSTK